MLIWVFVVRISITRKYLTDTAPAKQGELKFAILQAFIWIARNQKDQNTCIVQRIYAIRLCMLFG